MSYCKIGLHVGVGGNRQGFGPDYLARLASAGRPAVVKSVDDYGAIVETLSYNGDNICVYRKTGAPYENPDYNVLNPVDAGTQHYNRCIAALPPEFDKRTWLEMMNEPDKNRAEWLGQVAEVIATRCLQNGYKFAAFGWSAGEPEREHWEQMLPFLQLASDNPDRIAVALHEYSFDVGNIMAGYPYMLGRFQMLHEVCTAHGLSFPTILITEWGWTLDNVPTPDIAMQHIATAQELYGPHDNVLGAGLWYLGNGFGGIADKAQLLIDPLGQYAATGEFDYGEPPPPPEPDVYDLMEYMTAPVNVQTVLQCAFPDFQGTQTLCTLWKQPPVFYQQKDSEAEFLYYDQKNIYRWWDTSMGNIDGRKAFYEQNSVPDKNGAYWCDRFVSVGQEFGRNPIVTVRWFDNCGVVQQGQQQSGLVVKAWYPSYTFDTGFHIDVPVIELEWRISGNWEERYYYARGFGLVRWENCAGLRSWLVEIHVDRPPMAPPNIPACIPTPDLYYIPSEPPPPPPDPRARGIDISYWQGPDVDFEAVAASGIKFVIIRSSVGNSYVDPYFNINVSKAEAAGLYVGVYHVVKPWQSAESQMTHLANVLGGIITHMPIALDVELDEGQEPAALTAIVQECLDLAEEMVDPLGRVPMIYTGAWFWNRYIVPGDWSHYPLWVANYGVIEPLIPIGWEEWTIWQHTSSGYVPGVPGNVDMNYFNGTEEEFEEFCSTDMCGWCPGNPRVQYEREYWLVPQDVDASRWLDVCRNAYQSKNTVGMSWDDAGIGNLDVRRVIAFGFSPEQQAELDSFYDKFYPGVVLIFRDYPPSID